MNPVLRNGQAFACLVIGTAVAILFKTLALGAAAEGKQGEAASRATVGAYYFDGWAGSNRRNRLLIALGQVPAATGWFREYPLFGRRAQPQAPAYGTSFDLPLGIGAH